MKYLLFLGFIQRILLPSESISGVIWSKSQQQFTPIFSLPTFGIFRDQKLLKSEHSEQHVFNGEQFRLTYYEETNILDFHDNNTRISGMCGEAWNTLSESLNFTLKPIKEDVKGLGTFLKNGTFTKILGIISRNETDIIPTLDMFSSRYQVLKYTTPMWKNRQRLYIRQVEKNDNIWMVRVFSWKIWCAIVITHFLLTWFGFVSQRIKNKNSKIQCTFGEHYFYNFAMICNQNHTPSYFSGRSRIMQTTLSFFSSIVYISFSTLLFTYITRMVFIPPFVSVQTMVDNTDYTIVLHEGSIPDLAYKRGGVADLELARKYNRVIVLPTLEDVYEKTCSETKNYVMMISENVKKAKGSFICRLNPVGVSYLSTYLAPGIRKGFKHRQAINHKILKMHEVGIINVLALRWMEAQNTEDSPSIEPKPIIFAQVSLVFAVLATGVIVSIIILILENCMQLHKSWRNDHHFVTRMVRRFIPRIK